MEALNKIVDGVEKDLEKFKPVQDIAAALKVKPGHVVVVGFVVTFLLVLTGVFSEFITSVFGFLYPAYMSCKALEHEDNSHKTRSQWLTYWVVFAFIMFVDLIFGPILSFIPFYHVIKMLTFMWLFYPKSNGAGVLYEKIVRPYLKTKEQLIDKTLNEAESIIEDDVKMVTGGR